MKRWVLYVVQLAYCRYWVHDDGVTINAVLRDELWVGQTAQAVVDFLKAAGMTNVYLEKVANWKRDRVPSLEQMAEIECAHGLPRGWILWRAGYTDAEALVARGDAPPAPVTIVTQNPAEISLRLETLEQTMLAQGQLLVALRDELHGS